MWDPDAATEARCAGMTCKVVRWNVRVPEINSDPVCGGMKNFSHVFDGGSVAERFPV